MANIVNARIDERLIHGQVAAYWTNSLQATRIMVVDDAASMNEIQKTALKMACPGGVKLSVLTIEKCIARLGDPANYEGDRIFCVFKGTDSLRKAVEAGFPYKNITVGNISGKIGSVQVDTSLAVTPTDVENFRYMADNLGVKFIRQLVPGDEPQDFMPMLNKVAK